MKKIIALLFVSTLCILFCFGCGPYNNGVKSKPGEPIGPVTNAESSIFQGKIIITWDLPSSYPDDIIQPVSIRIKIIVDGSIAGIKEIDEAPTKFVYSPFEPMKNYRFIIKVKGKVDTSNPNIAHMRVSTGRVVVISSSKH